MTSTSRIVYLSLRLRGFAETQKRRRAAHASALGGLRIAKTIWLAAVSRRCRL